MYVCSHFLGVLLLGCYVHPLLSALRSVQAIISGKGLGGGGGGAPATGAAAPAAAPVVEEEEDDDDMGMDLFD